MMGLYVFMEEMNSKVLKKRSLFRDEICERIEEAIFTGELKAGDRIVETRWARELGVSQSPVREAIRLLESKGLVETVPFQGTYVRKASKKDIANLSRVRKVLEGMAVEEALDHLTEEYLEKIMDAYEKMLEAAREHNMVGYINYDTLFHRLIVELSPNEFLHRAWEQCNIKEWTFWGTQEFLQEQMEELAMRHEPICAALKARDKEALVREAAYHIDRLIDTVMAGSAEE